MKLRHYKELDGVRGLAALMVIFFHFFRDLCPPGTVPPLIQKFSAFGWTGVSLFFVLSGFLITRILINNKGTASYFLNFYGRRTLRIFPLYYLALVIVYFILPAIENTPVPDAGLQKWYWLYLQNFATTFKWPTEGPEHFWSLAIEEHFYLFWPLLVFLLNRKKLKIAIPLFFAATIITRALFLQNGLDVSRFTFTRLDELTLGALLAVWEVEGRLVTTTAKKFLLLFALSIIPVVGLWVFTTGQGLDLIQLSKFTLLALCYFGLIGYLVSEKEGHFIKRIFSTRPFTYAGKISYGLYVYHPICFALTGKYLPVDSVFLSLLVNCTLVFLVAGASYHFFEARFLKLKKRFPSASDGNQ
ncbi:MAG TPA: acyltransferase [Flavipsychrobacter sp.]|nr:acyltransferase [Flavipsychrobacter sp.]